jgi:hypothetical protein
MFDKLKEVSKKVKEAKLKSAKEGITMPSALKHTFWKYKHIKQNQNEHI